MKQKSILLFILLMISASSINIYAQNVSDKKWVPISNELIKNQILIYDVKANIKKKPQTDQYIGIIFGKGKNQVFLNTHKWEYNFPDNVNGGQKFKLKKARSDAQGFRHLDISQLGGAPILLVSYQENALIDSVQALIDIADYYYLKNENYNAIECYQKKTNIDDANAMFRLATLLEKGYESQQREAFDLFKKLANAGCKLANAHLAMFYLEGKYVNKDITKAEALLMMADDNDIRARYLLENLNEIYQNKDKGVRNRESRLTNYRLELWPRHKDVQWNPREEGLISPFMQFGILTKDTSFGISSPVNIKEKAREIMYEVITTEDVDIVNQTLKYVYTSRDTGDEFKYYKDPFLPVGHKEDDFIKPEWYKDDIKDRSSYRSFLKHYYGSSISLHKYDHMAYCAYWDACLKLLKTNDCGWIWIYLTMTGDLGDLNKKQNICDIPEVIWKALKVYFKKEDVNYQRKCLKSLIDKWCDLALQTSDVELYTVLFYKIVGDYILTDHIYANKVTINGLSYYKDHIVNTFITNYNSECLKKDLKFAKKVESAVKKGADLGIEPCIRCYEKIILDSI